MLTAVYLTNISDAINHLDINSQDIVVVGTGPWWQIGQMKLSDEPTLSCLESWETFPGGLELAKNFIEGKKNHHANG